MLSVSCRQSQGYRDQVVIQDEVRSSSDLLRTATRLQAGAGSWLAPESVSEGVEQEQRRVDSTLCIQTFGAGPCTYYCRDANGLVILALYDDDLILECPRLVLMTQLK